MNQNDQELFALRAQVAELKRKLEGIRAENERLRGAIAACVTVRPSAYKSQRYFCRACQCYGPTQVLGHGDGCIVAALASPEREEPNG